MWSCKSLLQRMVGPSFQKRVMIRRLALFGMARRKGAIAALPETITSELLAQAIPLPHVDASSFQQCSKCDSLLNSPSIEDTTAHPPHGSNTALVLVFEYNGA
jgi:hypothetical protein